ncbi:hypothetical protein QE152_g27800 [Popillia japonica]|uniref:HTH psq-type domain-containing protein n=1 Tax=Popillia japonica TaxID=7064 RepID=A0AAW1JLN4_POPJA
MALIIVKYRRERKHNRVPISEEIIKRAIREVIRDKKSIRVTAAKYAINKSTLFKRIKFVKHQKNNVLIDKSANSSDDDFVTIKATGKHKHKNRQIFTDAQELELKEYLLRSSNINYGFTYTQTRKLAFEYAKHLNIPLPKNWDTTRSAGVEWMKGFMLQPLDVSVYGPFKAALRVAFNDFMISNPGKLITIYTIPKLVRTAYVVSFTNKNIISGFEKPGIWPFNRLVFTELDFDSAYVTDRPQTEVVQILNNYVNAEEENNNKKIENTENNIGEKELSRASVRIEDIRPYPKASERKQKSRQRIKSKILTDSPKKTDTSFEQLRNVITSSDGATPNIKNLLDSDMLQESQFLLVKFIQKRTNIFYTAKIIKVIDQNDFDVMFLRYDQNKFVFPLVDDISQIRRCNIVAVLPNPLDMPGTSRSRQKFRFSVDLSAYNMR